MMKYSEENLHSRFEIEYTTELTSLANLRFFGLRRGRGSNTAPEQSNPNFFKFFNPNFFTPGYILRGVLLNYQFVAMEGI